MKELEKYLLKRLKILYNKQDAYLIQGGNGCGFSCEIDELKRLAKHFKIKLKKDLYIP